MSPFSSRFRGSLTAFAFAVSLLAAAQPAPAEAPKPVAAPAAATAAPAPAAGDADKQRATELTSLRLLRDKKVISEEEYQAALRDLGELGGRAGDTNTFVFGKLQTSIYGFVQVDFLYNSTQSFGPDFSANLQVARPGTYAANNGRLVFTARDSRLGFRLRAPAPPGYSATAVFEGDFLGSEPGIFQNTGGTPPTPGSTNSEGGFFGNPTFRIRHAFLRAETPLVDVVVGQAWNLLGWQPTYIPAVVQWPGLIGELYGRSVQLRLSKTFKTDLVTVEAAAAAARPVQRDSSIPNGAAGVRLSFPKWSGVHTAYLTGTSASPLSFALTGDVRAFRIPEFSVDPQAANAATGGGVAVDAFIPIIPGTLANRGGTMALTAEYARGAGIGDQYTAFSSGITNPALPPSGPGGQSPAFNPRVDANLAAYDTSGVLHLVETQTFFASLEYYLPVLEGRIGLMAGYYHTDILNVDDFTNNPAAIRRRAQLFEAGAMFDPIPQIRLAADWGLIRDVYKDGVVAWNWSVLGSAFFFF